MLSLLVLYFAISQSVASVDENEDTMYLRISDVENLGRSEDDQAMKEIKRIRRRVTIVRCCGTDTCFPSVSKQRPISGLTAFAQFSNFGVYITCPGCPTNWREMLDFMADGSNVIGLECKTYCPPGWREILYMNSARTTRQMRRKTTTTTEATDETDTDSTDATETDDGKTTKSSKTKTTVKSTTKKKKAKKHSKTKNSKPKEKNNESKKNEKNSVNITTSTTKKEIRKNI